MERLMKGDIVVVLFPFSDLSSAKNRPAMVLAKPKGDGLILCQITSKHTKDGHSIPVTESDFKSGSLNQDSNIRPNKIFTADTSIIDYTIRTLSTTKTSTIVEAVCSIIRS